MGNQIDHLADVSLLSGCVYLRSVEFERSGRSNPICDEDGYRATIFRALPTLRSLDAKNKEGMPADEEVLSEVRAGGKMESPERATGKRITLQRARKGKMRFTALETPLIDKVCPSCVPRDWSVTHSTSCIARCWPNAGHVRTGPLAVRRTQAMKRATWPRAIA